MSKNMVERVADAVRNSVSGPPMREDTAITIARAAIGAMRSPTEAMVEAAHVAEPNPVLGGYALEEDGPGTIWNAMITVALKP